MLWFIFLSFRFYLYWIVPPLQLHMGAEFVERWSVMFYLRNRNLENLIGLVRKTWAEWKKMDIWKNQVTVFHNGETSILFWEQGLLSSEPVQKQIRVSGKVSGRVKKKKTCGFTDSSHTGTALHRFHSLNINMLFRLFFPNNMWVKMSQALQRFTRTLSASAQTKWILLLSH